MGYKPLQGKRLQDIKLSNKYNLNARIIAIPIVAFTMASLLFVYTRSSIYAAKRNAERHRIADGGQISWRNESQRRHGVLDKPDEKITLKGLLGWAEDEKGTLKIRNSQASKEEEAIRARRVKRRGDKD
ncbi:MAG: hypothetical protein Q9164_000214 [Protoblastenia rupestris]